MSLMKSVCTSKEQHLIEFNLAFSHIDLICHKCQKINHYVLITKLTYTLEESIRVYEKFNFH